MPGIMPRACQIFFYLVRLGNLPKVTWLDSGTVGLKTKSSLCDSKSQAWEQYTSQPQVQQRWVRSWREAWWHPIRLDPRPVFFSVLGSQYFRNADLYEHVESRIPFLSFAYRPHQWFARGEPQKAVKRCKVHLSQGDLGKFLMRAPSFCEIRLLASLTLGHPLPLSQGKAPQGIFLVEKSGWCCGSLFSPLTLWFSLCGAILPTTNFLLLVLRFILGTRIICLPCICCLRVTKKIC